jgi:L-ascorbate metabolism protein UlaG (beta-lactamase superfamily)
MIHLAPAAVMRAAAWPLECFEAFGDPDGAALGLKRDAFRYEHVLAAERRALWTRLLDDDRFDAALALSSPSTRARARAVAARREGVRNRSTRLVEQTLYRYVSRASGRATPHGLWAGVTEVRFGERSAVETAPLRGVFAPDLRAFRGLVRGLAARPAYRDRAPFGLNPTLHPHAGSQWRYHQRLEDGRVLECAVDLDPGAIDLIGRLASMAPAPLIDLASAVVRRAFLPLASTRSVRAGLEVMAREGMLVGGLDLPTRFDTPREALARFGSRLLPSDRTPWERAVAELTEVCARLSSDVASLSGDRVMVELGRARDAMVALAGALGLDPALVGEERVVTCDLRLPYRVTLGPEVVRSLETALSDFERCWLAGFSPASAVRELERRRIGERLGAGLSLGEAAQVMARARPIPSTWPAPEAVTDVDLSGRVAAWQDAQRAAGEETTLAPEVRAPAVTLGPLGSFFVGPGRDGSLRVHSVSDSPTLSTSRFGSILEDLGVRSWLRAQLAALGARTGVELAELSVTHPANPNVMAGPVVLPDRLEPWSVGDDAVPLAGATVARNARGRPVLRLRDREGEWGVLSFSAANVQGFDPVARALLLTGLQEATGHGLRAVDVPSALELSSLRHRGRVRLPGGGILRPRRSVLSKDLAALAAARGGERFDLWQRHARELGWPQDLRVRPFGGEALRIRRDSPLGVEAVFKGVDAGTPFLIVEDASAEEGIEVPGLGTFAAELGVSFARDDEGSPAEIRALEAKTSRGGRGTWSLNPRHGIRLAYADTSRFGGMISGRAEQELRRRLEPIQRFRAEHGLVRLIRESTEVLDRFLGSCLEDLYAGPERLEDAWLYPDPDRVVPFHLNVTWDLEGVSESIPVDDRITSDLASYLGDWQWGARAPRSRAAQGLWDHLVRLGALVEDAPGEAIDRGAGVTFVGHATLDVGDGAHRVLIDPFLLPPSDRYPAGWQPLTLTDLGRPDAVLITHSHPDHYDLGTLLRCGADTPIYVPAVPRESVLSVDMAARLRELGFRSVHALSDWEERSVGGLRVVALPFHGEQPTVREVLHPEVRNEGATYLVEAAGERVVALADAGTDGAGDVRDVAGLARARYGDATTVFGGYRGFAMYPVHYLFSSVSRYLPFVPRASWGTRQQIMCDAHDLLDVAERWGARRVVPYAAGGAPWYWLRGLGPCTDGSAPDALSQDPLPESVRAAARHRGETLADGPLASPVEVEILQAGAHLAPGPAPSDSERPA